MWKIVEPTEEASPRTKNRIKDSGPRFHLGREMPVINFEGKSVKARLLHSLKNDWVGWVPVYEITIY